MTKPIVQERRCPHCGHRKPIQLGEGLLTKSDLARFWSKVDIRGPDECWPWLGRRKEWGYGMFTIHGRNTTAHRVAWWMHTGVWPGEKKVRHVVCDNPPCCNPAHLAEGTDADNVRDMMEKGRNRSHGELPSLRGEGNPSAKLTESDVREILVRFDAGEAGAALAEEKGVCKDTAYRILRGERWKHVSQSEGRAARNVGTHRDRDSSGRFTRSH
jgi:hypothetical protein